MEDRKGIETFRDLKAKAKEVKITDYLQRKGIEPKRKKGKDYVYSAPYREDKTPSMLVDENTNLFTDLGENNSGDIITLVQLTEKIDFKQAVEYLTNQSYQSQSKPESEKQKPNKTLEVSPSIKLLEVKELTHPALTQYLKERKISIKAAKRHCKEAHFEIRKKKYFAIYFPNEKGGGELRSKNFKSCINPKGYALIKGRKNIFAKDQQKTDQINVFEGFMDFLASLSIKEKIEPNQDTLILNSTALTKKAIPIIQEYEQVNCFLDNDQTGNITTQEIKKSLNENSKFKDYRYSYKKHKDFAEYHQKTSEKRSLKTKIR